MTDLNKIAENYIAAWNETDAGRRKAASRRPSPAGVSLPRPDHAGRRPRRPRRADRRRATALPGFRFALKGQPDGFENHIRFSWELGPEGMPSVIEGTDIGVIEDGRLSNVTGFLDKVPAQ